MQAPLALKQLVYPSTGGLRDIEFREGSTPLTAAIPDQERFGLAREVLLQRIYDLAGPIDGGLVVDAGANTGLFSLVASQSADKVVAIEPDPDNYRTLTANLARNEIENVEAINAALWTHGGEVAFSTGQHVTDGAVTERGGETVQSITLDSIVAEHGAIDLLKLDIEGAEEKVIPSSRAIAAARRIVAELHLSRPGQEAEMVAALEGRGFTVAIVPARDLYTPGWVANVLHNWRNLRGETLIKAGLVSYLLAPVTKPRRPGRDMPLLLARR